LKNNTLYTFNSAFAADSASGSSILNIGMWAAAILIIFFLIIQVSDNLIRIEGKEAGLDADQQAGLSLNISMKVLSML